MNLQETTDTILIWIESCKTEDQVNLCFNAANEFVYNRFRFEVKGPVMDIAMSDIGIAVCKKLEELNPKKEAPKKVSEDTYPYSELY